MTAIAHDTRVPGRPGSAAPGRLASGLSFAVVSAASFGLSGALARGLLDTGWSPGAVVVVRVGIAALVVAPFGAVALRGRWSLLRRNAGLITLYGVLAVAGAQFCYFSAVTYMQVGPALLIEYTAPAAVVLWLWVRHQQRPGAVTLAGAGLAALGLVLVLDLLSGAEISTTGVLWALGAMVGAAAYFVISADEDNGLPPMVLAAGGLAVGTATLGLLGAVGLLAMDVSTAPAVYSGRSVTWWVPLLALAVVTAALAYTTGIAASRRLGSRLASFVALLEVLMAVGFAWLLLGELPRAVQLLGGVLVLAGVVVVKLGERESSPVRTALTDPAPEDSVPASPAPV
ncbi:EamA family transporter [Actinotalea sp. K2]|uniref:EamA family transporter n=1 Tax=Actinotalea sp. K2 TaxID=2939438 RepID=UPI002016A849|nr:DMT family transporter [Actinotalea sp. K2]MCL3860824.1 DMT family transporter [Actinotalea sp. K2]